MIIRFTKMQGIGNDYIYIDATKSCLPVDFSKLSIKMSDRHFGIGGDGIILILPSDKADFKMRMFNADGSEGKMCGNASRCIAKFLYEKNLTNKKVIMLETLAGIKPLMITENDGIVTSVTVDMGQPDFTPNSIPVVSDSEMIKTPLATSQGVFLLTCLSMGNPHAVIFIDDFSLIDIATTGKEIENHDIFPERTNVEFAQVINRNEIKMRVWERGSGETLACGTGACATLAAAVVSGLCDRKATLHLLGGDLHINWEESNDHIYMTGGAEFVFEGEYEFSE